MFFMATCSFVAYNSEFSLSVFSISDGNVSMLLALYFLLFRSGNFEYYSFLVLSPYYSAASKDSLTSGLPDFY